MGWTETCQRRRWHEYSLDEWTKWVESLPPKGFGRLDKEGWSKWVDKMIEAEGQPRPPPAKGPPAQGDSENCDDGKRAKTTPTPGPPASGSAAAVIFIDSPSSASGYTQSSAPTAPDNSQVLDFILGDEVMDSGDVVAYRLHLHEASNCSA